MAIPDIIRKIAVVLAFIAIAGLQYYLAHLPVALDVAGQSPLVAVQGQQLAIIGPAVSGPLLAYLGRLDEAVDVRFERGKLAPETLALLRALQFDPPTEGEIGWITEGGRDSKTFIEIALVKPVDPSAVLHVFQLAEPPSNHPRFEIRAEGAVLDVRMGDFSRPGARGASARKILRINEWQQALPGEVPVKVVMPAGTGLRLRFSAPASPWGGDGMFAPFVLGAPQTTPGAPPPVQARGVGIRSLPGEEKTAFDLILCGAAAGKVLWRPNDVVAGRCDAATGSLLRLDNFKVGPDRIQIGVAGSGWAAKKGQMLTENLMTRLEQNKPVAALLALANTALAGWVWKVLFGKKPNSGD